MGFLYIKILYNIFYRVIKEYILSLFTWYIHFLEFYETVNQRMSLLIDEWMKLINNETIGIELEIAEKRSSSMCYWFMNEWFKKLKNEELNDTWRKLIKLMINK